MNMKKAAFAGVLGLAVIGATVACVPEEEGAISSKSPAGVESVEEAGVGAVVRDGKLEFTVNSWDGVSSINLTVTNIGNGPEFIFDDNIKMVDNQGRTFTPVDDWSSPLWISELQPGQSVSGQVNYDLFGAVPSHLMLHDSMFSGGARVNLN